MKHLKKLSVVLMMITLFSGTFTSCIDNEVSPLVEAIYEAQADLIAAQANVQNAEAALLLAQAANEEANAALLEAQATAAVSIAQGQLAVLLANAGLTDAQAQAILSAAEGDLAQALADAGLTEAQAAQIMADIADQEADAAYYAALREQELLALVAQTSLDVAALQNELALAQIQFDVDMAAAIAAMEAAGVQLAVGYAWDYAYAMQHANGLMQDLLEAQADLASAQLMQNGNVSWEFYLAQMEGNVATAVAAKADLETAIANLEAYIADPSTPEAMISDLKAQNIAYHEAMDAKEIEMQVQYNKIMELYAQTGVRSELEGRAQVALADHNAAVDEKNLRLEDIEDAQEDVDDLTDDLATYATDLSNANNAVLAANTAYNDAWTALGKKDSQGTDIGYANYFMFSGKTSAPEAIAAGATKYAAPANFQQVYVNAKIDKLNADADLADYQTDFNALVVTYNQAAVTLAAAQLAFDNSTAAADLTAANSAYTTALGIRNTALNTTYADAKAAFELDPTGVVWFDGDDTGFNWLQTPYIGDHTDGALNPNSFRKIMTWVQPNILVDAFYPGIISATNLDVIPANVVDNPATLVIDETLNNYELGAPGYLTAAQVVVNNNGNSAYYVNVENDDYSLTKLYIFNVATNMLGTNNFSTRPFFTSGAGTLASPYVFNAVLTPADVDAGYDSTPNANGLADGAPDMLTAQAALWNAGLEKFKKQNAFDLGDDALIIAENAFAYQKELFDNGVANLAELADDVTAATTAQTAAKKAVDEAWLKLGVEYAAGIATDPKKTTSTAGAWYDADFSGPGTAKALTLNAVVFNAEVTKAVLAACNAACIQGQIDALNVDIVKWTLENVNIQLIIDAKYAVVAGLLGELTAAGVEYTFTVEDDETTGNLGIGTLVITNVDPVSIGGFATYSDLHAAIIAEYQIYWAMGQELDALQNAHNLNASLISAYGWWSDDLDDLADMLEDLQEDLVEAIEDIELAEQALAAAQVEEAADEAYIAYLEALIDTIEQRHANTLAIAAKYKALMEAALAS